MNPYKVGMEQLHAHSCSNPHLVQNTMSPTSPPCDGIFTKQWSTPDCNSPQVALMPCSVDAPLILQSTIDHSDAEVSTGPSTRITVPR